MNPSDDEGLKKLDPDSKKRGDEELKKLDPNTKQHDVGDLKNAADSLGKGVQLNQMSRLDQMGFDRTPSGKEPGLFDKKEPTVHEKLREKVVGKLPEEQRKAYDEEQKKIDQHRQDVARWGMSNIYPPPPYPKAPETPVHDEVERKTKAAERQIAERTRGGMSQEDREKLDKQTSEYEAALEKTRIKNPAGTGEWHKKPKPGSEMQRSWDSINEAVDQY